MNRSKNIEAMLAKCDEQFAKLKADYRASLAEKEVSAALKVDLKNIFDNLRSCLDYIAHDLYHHCLPKLSVPPRLYFPIRSTRPEFEKTMKKDYPGLETGYKSVFDLLDSIQPYHDVWLSKFNSLNNANKHQDLTAQTKSETQTVKVSGPGGGSVSWGSGVKFGGGVSVFGVPIDPATQLPVPNPEVKTELVTWVDFQFGDTADGEVDRLLEHLGLPRGFPANKPARAPPLSFGGEGSQLDGFADDGPQRWASGSGIDWPA